jgi:CBS domain-containing protein
METIKVKDLMVTLNDYVCVPPTATLQEAFEKLEQAQKNHEAKGFPHRAILVCDDRGKVLGKLAQLDVLRALEPRYSELSDLKKVSGFGLSSEFMQSMMSRYELWKAPLEDLCRKASHIHLSDVVSSPLAGELIDENATLDKAIHQMIMGHHQLLLVTSGENIIGILRVSDVFQEVNNRIKSCKI